jgi:DNA repair protein REV1
MITCLAKEVENRMALVGVKGSKVTLKLKQRKPGAPPPPKFLGHGSCFNLSKSCETPHCTATSDHLFVSKICMELFCKMAVKVDDIRGMG